MNIPSTSSDSLLDGDGRCRKSDLLPSDCGCTAHRGGQTPEEEALTIEYTEYLISNFRLAKYAGHCKLNYQHRIEISDPIGLAVKENNISEEIGWVCEYCTDKISYPEA